MRQRLVAVSAGHTVRLLPSDVDVASRLVEASLRSHVGTE
jgi:hypothetical protein